MAEEFDIQADGATLRGRRWKVSAGPVHGTALIIHGIGEHSARYEHVALEINKLGIDVVSYDQRGHGRSDGKHGVIPYDDTLVKDAMLVFKRVAAESKTTPFLIAHSMGGAIAAFAVTTGKITPRALVLSSPAIRPVLRIPESVLRWLYRHWPNLGLPSLIRPGQLTSDPEMLKQIVADTTAGLMHVKASPRLAVSILDQGAAALAKANGLELDTLVLIGTSDTVVEPEKAKEFADAMPPKRATKKVYEGFLHEVFNETDRRKVLEDLTDWLGARLSESAGPGSSAPLP
jgi:alpha-beta hydrolase superfamily lysophospholipase